MADESSVVNWQKGFEGEVRDAEYGRINARRSANGFTRLPEKVSDTSPVDVTGLALPAEASALRLFLWVRCKP
jgi:hypothetical protein